MKFTHDNIPFKKLPHDYKFSVMKITNFKIKAWKFKKKKMHKVRLEVTNRVNYVYKYLLNKVCFKISIPYKLLVIFCC